MKIRRTYCSHGNKESDSSRGQDSNTPSWHVELELDVGRLLVPNHAGGEVKPPASDMLNTCVHVGFFDSLFLFDCCRFVDTRYRVSRLREEEGREGCLEVEVVSWPWQPSAPSRAQAAASAWIGPSFS